MPAADSRLARHQNGKDTTAEVLGRLLPSNAGECHTLEVSMTVEEGEMVSAQVTGTTYQAEQALLDKMPYGRKRRVKESLLVGTSRSMQGSEKGLGYQRADGFVLVDYQRITSANIGALAKLKNVPLPIILSHFINVIDSSFETDNSSNALIAYVSNLDETLRLEYVSALNLVKSYFFFVPGKILDDEDLGSLLNAVWKDTIVRRGLLRLMKQDNLANMMESLSELLDNLAQHYDPEVKDTVVLSDKNSNKALERAHKLVLPLAILTVLSLPVFAVSGVVAAIATAAAFLPLAIVSIATAAVSLLPMLALTSLLVGLAVRPWIKEKISKSESETDLYDFSVKSTKGTMKKYETDLDGFSLKSTQEIMEKLDKIFEKLSQNEKLPEPEQLERPSPQDDEVTYQEKFGKFIFWQGVKGVKKVCDENRSKFSPGVA